MEYLIVSFYWRVYGHDPKRIAAKVGKRDRSSGAFPQSSSSQRHVRGDSIRCIRTTLLPGSRFVFGELLYCELEDSRIVYIRQSTVTQVIEHKESQRRQYALAKRAEGLGFKTVDIIDEDLGRWCWDWLSVPGSRNWSRPCVPAMWGRCSVSKHHGFLAMERTGIIRYLVVLKLQLYSNYCSHKVFDKRHVYCSTGNFYRAGRNISLISFLTGKLAKHRLFESRGKKSTGGNRNDAA